MGKVELLTDQDFIDLIISAAIKNQGNFCFAPVKNESLSSKVQAASGYVRNFIVSNNQTISPSISSYKINIEQFSDLSQLIKFIHSRSKAGKAFREKAIEDFCARFPDGEYPEPRLTALVGKLDSMSPMAWQQLLFKAQNDSPETHLTFEYLMKPVSSEENAQRLVFLGEPGIGKSDLLRFVGAICAENFSHIPIYIDLSEYRSKNNFESILEQCTKLIDDKCSLDSLLKRGDLLLLLDGLDSINPKSHLYKSLNIFNNLNKQCHILLSCDKDSGHKYLDLIGDYQLALINGLSLPDQQKFAKAKLDKHQQVFFDALRQDDEILRLCANPSFLFFFLTAIMECNDPEDLQTKWHQLDYLLTYALEGHNYDEANLRAELTSLATQILKIYFPNQFSSVNRSNKSLRKLLSEMNILVRNPNSQDQEYHFSNPTLFAYFAATFLLQNKKALNCLLNPSSSEDLLYSFANHPLLRELFLMLFLNNKIPSDWVKDLLDPDKDDKFLHRITLGIKVLSQKQDHLQTDTEITSLFDCSVKKILGIWENAKYAFKSDHLWIAIKDIALLYPELIAKYILPSADGAVEIESEEVITKIANLSLLKAKALVTYLDSDTTITRSVLKTRYVLNLLKKLTFYLDSITQEKILDLLDIPAFEFEVLALLGRSSLDADKRIEAIDLLTQMIENPGCNLKQKTDKTKKQELELTCAALAHLGLDIKIAQVLICNLLTTEESENFKGRQSTPFDRTWLAIELAQYYDLSNFTIRCRELILLELGKLSNKDGFLEFSKQTAARMFEKTKDYKTRKTLTSIIWFKPAKPKKPVKLSEILHSLTQAEILEWLVPENWDIEIEDEKSLQYLFTELCTRKGEAAIYVLDVTVMRLLAGTKQSEVTDIIKRLLNFYIYGTLIEKERILRILSEVPIKSVSSEVVNQLQKYVKEKYESETEISDDVLKLYVKFSKFTKINRSDSIYRILEDKISNSNTSETDFVSLGEDLVLSQLQFLHEDQNKLQNLIEVIANNDNTAMVNNPFYCQLDKAGFRFWSKDDNGQEKINVTYC